MALSDFEILQHGPGQEDAPWPYEAQLYFGRKVEKDAVAEHERALAFLAGLYTGDLAIDGPPMDVAERIFDSVMAERRELKNEIKRKEQALDFLRNNLTRARLEKAP